MIRYVLAAILLLALAVLTFVQFRLLLAGVRLEKQRFDQRTEDALLAVADTLNQPGALSDALIEHLKIGPPTDSVVIHPLTDLLDALIGRQLRQRGVRASFAFVLTNKYGTQALLANNNFEEGTFSFGRYSVPLGNHIIASCHFEPSLHFDVPNLFGYLLGELRNLVVPSVLCLLAILLCFGLLLNILEKERKLNTIKNDFINNLTHELKTPVFSIALSSKMALESLEKNEPGRLKKFLQLIENENAKVKTHVEKVLELGSLESARFTLQKTPASMHELIREVLLEFLPQTENGEVALVERLEAVADMVPVDRAHFKNALRNLLENALKYSPGEPTIVVATKSDGRRFYLSVMDNGKGIAPEYSKQIFDKFFRIPSDGAQHVKGFGLGLNYVWQIAKAHGGTAEVESEVGKGSKFTIALPL
ncbi:MAG: HAMP domain-containing histidine kinase [Bacteroidetes bacterium]|nr:HAMP domain-containing histidine kinase [Bacteroidota bacterium]